MQWLGQQALMTLPEYVDASNAKQIRDELLAVINSGAEALIADLTATVFCDQAGTDAVARAYQRAASIRTPLRLVVTSGAVLQILSKSGVGRLVPVYPSVPAALAALWPAANPRPGRPGRPRPGRAVKPAERDDGHQRDGHQRDGHQRDGHQRDGHQRGGPETDAGVEVALLNRDGVIIWTNQAWQAFAAANGGDRVHTGPGVSYLQACADAGDDSVAADVAAAIRAALAGDLPGPLAIEVPCHSPATERWYDVLISARLDDLSQCAGAAVTLSLARSQPREPREPASAVTVSLLWKMIDAVSDGVALADGYGTLMLANRWSRT